MGNAATGFFVTFSLIAGVVGIASVFSGLNHLRFWNLDSMPAAANAAAIAWSLTLLAMGYVIRKLYMCLESDLDFSLPTGGLAEISKCHFFFTDALRA